jgi:hypothetical protein
MNELTLKMIEKVKRVRENNPPAVDELLAALELCPVTEKYIDQWLYRMWDEKLLDPKNVYLDLLTYE